MSMHSMTVVQALALVLAACGRSSPAATPADAAQLRALSSGIVRSTESYGARASSATTPPACRAARSDYEEQVRPAIEGMLALAPRVDERMRTRGLSQHADVECGGGAMLAEFERHTDIACTSLGLEVNRAEAAQHAMAMGRWAGLAVARAEEVGMASGPELPAGGGGGPRCVRFADGSHMYLP
jgi:hypothetical protein